MARQTRLCQNGRGPDIVASPMRSWSPAMNNETENMGENTRIRGQSSTREQRLPSSRVEKPVKKFKQTMSAASVFGRASKDTRHDKRTHRHKAPSPVTDLYRDLHSAVGDVQATIGGEMKMAFENVYSSLSEKLAASTTQDEKMFEIVSETIALLSTPLYRECIETSVKRDGNLYKKVVRVGERIAAFKEMVEKEKSMLQDYWKQWDEVQNEYLELGIQVFGLEASHEEIIKGTKEGYKKGVELLKLEQSAEAEQFEKEVEEMSVDSLEMVKKFEKELDDVVKKEQAKLLQHLFAGS